jgi:hypothetical protein
VLIVTNLLILSGKREKGRIAREVERIYYLFVLGNSNYREFTLVSNGEWIMIPLAAQFHKDTFLPR